MGDEHDDQRHHGQDDVGKGLRHVFGKGDVACGGEEVEHGAGKGDDEQRARGEFRHGNADVGAHLYDAVHGAVAAKGRKHAEGNGDDGHDHDAEGGQNGGILQTEQQQGQYGLIHGKGMAEVAVQHAPYPSAVLLVEGQVQAHLFLKSAQRVIRGEFPEDDLGEIAGKNHGDGENDDGNAKKCDKHETEAFQDINRTQVLPFSALGAGRGGGGRMRPPPGLGCQLSQTFSMVKKVFLGLRTMPLTLL